MGVPKPAAERLAGPLLAAAAALLLFMSIIMISILIVIISVVGEEEELRDSTRHPEPEAGVTATAPAGSAAPIPQNVLDAYLEATDGTFIPWTILASIGEVASGNGTGLSPLIHGPVGLASSLGFVPPASGPVILVGDASLPVEPALSGLGEVDVSVVSLQEASSLPSMLHGLEAPPGSTIIVSLGPSLADLSAQQYQDVVARASASLPATVSLLWLTADLPDWREVPVVECSAIPGAVPPSERSRESYYPWSPEYVPPGDGSVDGCRQTGTRMELASDDNLAEPLNSVLREVAALWAHVHTLDASGLASGGKRPGPTGSYQEELAVDGADALAARMRLASERISHIRGYFTPAPSGRCPRISGRAVNGGEGVFGLQEDVLRELGVTVGSRDLSNTCHSAQMLAEALEIIAVEEAEMQGTTLRSLLLRYAPDARSDPEAKRQLDLFWEQVLARSLPIISRPGDQCLFSLEAEAQGSVEDSIAGMWRCVVQLAETPQWEVVETEAGGRLLITSLSPFEAAGRAVRDALEVAERHSGTTPCNLFPMSDAQFARYAPEGFSDRCDPRVESYAAARMFHEAASASEPASSWETAAAGWHVFEGVMGDDSVAAKFRESGPYRGRIYPESCIQDARRALISAALPLAGQYNAQTFYELAEFRDLGSEVVADELRAALRVALATAVEEVLAGECASGLRFPQEYYRVLREASVAIEGMVTPAAMSDRAPSRISTPARTGDVVYALGLLADSSQEVPFDLSANAPLLGRISHSRLPLELSSLDAMPQLPAGRMLSQVLVGIYSQFPGLYQDMAWELSGQGEVSGHVPFAQDFNSFYGRIDPRLLLAMARSSGPLDPQHNCGNPDSASYGLFGITDPSIGCADLSAQFAHVVSEFEALLYAAEGRVQGAVYAWSLGDESLAELFAANDGELRAFAEEASVGIEELGPGPRGRSVLAFWYESQMLFVGDYAAAITVTTSCPLAPKPYVSGFAHPIAVKVPVPVGGSAFGMRDHPILREDGKPVRRHHNGVDWGVPSGTPIHAVAPGTVSSIRHRGGYGYTVEIAHADGMSSLYAHLSSGSAAVSVGQQVTGGQVVACSGNTGLSTGPHLHFEIRSAGAPLNPCSLGACD